MSPGGLLHVVIKGDEQSVIRFRYYVASATTAAWMADSHVISALQEKRATVAGCIARLERQLNQRWADFSHIDGVLRLFVPDRDPEAIKPKRPYARRTRYFGRASYLGCAEKAYGTTNGQNQA